MKKNIIFLVVIAVVVVAGAAAFLWSYNQTVYYQENSEEIALQAAEQAKKEQFAADEDVFNQKLKEPYTKFSGPTDLGAVTFNYPRTWSAYNIQNDTKGYEIVFYPGVIPPIDDDTPVALRVMVINQSYESELEGYESAVEKGELTATPITVNGDQDGVQFNGNLSDGFTSSFILLKLRDKTLFLQTDTGEYLGDFDDTVVASLEFAP